MTKSKKSITIASFYIMRIHSHSSLALSFSLLCMATALGFQSFTIPTAQAACSSGSSSSSSQEVFIQLSDSADPVEPGETFSYTVKVTNSSGSSIAKDSITLSLDSDLTFISATNAGTESNGVVTWTNLNIAGGSSEDVTANVRVNSNADDGDELESSAFGSDSDCEVTTVEDDSDGDEDIEIRITEDDPDPVEPGDEIEYEIEIENNDNQDHTIDITAFLDNDMDFVSASNSGDDNGDEVEWEDFDIDEGETRTLTLTVEVENSADDGDRLELRVEAGDDEDSEFTDVEDDSSSNDDIEIRITRDSPDPVEPGDEIDYTIVIENNDNQDHEVDVKAFLDSDVSFVSASDGGDEDDDEVEWDNIDVDEDDTETITLTVRVDSSADDGDRLALRVEADGENDTEYTEVDDDGTTNAKGDILVNIEKNSDRNEAMPGDRVFYTIIVRNLSSSKSTGTLTVEDMLSGGDITIEDTAGGTVVGEDRIRWTISSLVPEGVFQRHYSVRMGSNLTHGRTISNIATVVGDDIRGTLSASESVRIIESGPDTGVGGFAMSMIEKENFLKIWPKKSVESAAASEKQPTQSPAAPWASLATLGTAAGGFFGRKFLV